MCWVGIVTIATDGCSCQYGIPDKEEGQGHQTCNIEMQKASFMDQPNIALEEVVDIQQKFCNPAFGSLTHILLESRS